MADRRTGPCLALVAALIAGLPARGRGQAAPDSVAPPGALFDIGGYKLHMKCSGTGTPTVVLLHGFNDYSFVWDLVQPEVSRFTRVCAYDRAGQAWSDPGPRPRGLARLTEELHALLRSAGERGPFVLVGHSWGGLIPRVYASRYRADLAGVVFVDATHEDDYLEVRDTLVRPLVVPDSVWHRLWPVAPPSAGPPPSFRPRAPTTVLPPFDRLPAVDQHLFLWARARPVYFSNGDWEDIRDDFRLLHSLRAASPFPLGDLPTVVLSAMQREDSDESGVTAAEQRAVWERGQEDLSRQSRDSRWIQAPNSGHDIHLIEPDLVTEAIRQVVVAFRSRTTLCCRAAP